MEIKSAAVCLQDLRPVSPCSPQWTTGSTANGQQCVGECLTFWRPAAADLTSYESKLRHSTL